MQSKFFGLLRIMVGLCEHKHYEPREHMALTWRLHHLLVRDWQRFELAR